MKYLGLFFLFTLITSNAFAEGPLEKLPFNIVIGQTKNSEIESKGICVKRIQVSDGYYRCELYEMLNGKFWINSSQNELVIELSFSTKSTNSLPQSWKNIGLFLSQDRSGKGTTQKDFLEIIKSNNAVNINVQTEANTSSVSFDIGANHFDATFFNDNGLVKMDITEAY